MLLSVKHSSLFDFISKSVFFFLFFSLQFCLDFTIDFFCYFTNCLLKKEEKKYRPEHQLGTILVFT